MTDVTKSRHGLRIDLQEVARLAALAAEGLRGSEIARRLGWTPTRVFQVAASRGIPVRHATREEMAATARANAVRHRSCPAPRWVPRDLREDYRDLARDLGTAYAASAVRRLMEDAR